ncbi:TPA: hypothetical protein ACGO3V_000605 [Streptococcus suis]
MAKTSWYKTLEEVLKHKTITVKLISEKTGNEYEAEVVEKLKVLSTGAYEATVDGKFKYSIVDVTNNLEYDIKTSNFVDIKFGTTLEFKNLRGGVTSNGIGWYVADSVAIVKDK